MVVAAQQNEGWLASRETSCRRDSQDARCRATDVSEIDKKRELSLKAYYWEITMLNSNFLVERLCGSACALPRVFIWPSELARTGELIHMRCHSM